MSSPEITTSDYTVTNKHALRAARNTEKENQVYLTNQSVGKLWSKARYIHPGTGVVSQSLNKLIRWRTTVVYFCLRVSDSDFHIILIIWDNGDEFERQVGEKLFDVPGAHSFTDLVTRFLISLRILHRRRSGHSDVMVRPGLSAQENNGYDVILMASGTMGER
ncbi:hypothetical protein RRG08_020133 [Elysia crispata]|uniref:Uncharacterized protein n=1 Tax=Elysia crispata TaxID=231223 RepID=A0AAE1A4I1_9GAST|nr:hypothetical protein RRG08_020133 [Elysia crispata]